MSIGLSMNLSQELCLRTEMRQEQRMQLEQRLQQKLSQQLNLQMTLGQYLLHEDIITGLIHWADGNNGWARFRKGGFDFTYARVPHSVAAPIADIAGPGFAHCQYNPFEGRAMGDWTVFVVSDMVPRELEDFVAIHERGEEISHGNHFFASQLEFAYVSERGKLRKHIAWIDEAYPSKFIDLTQKVLFPILPQELLDFLTKEGKRNKEEIARAEELMKKHPLPSIVLKLMDKYESATAKVCEAIRQGVGIAQHKLYLLSQGTTSYVPPEAAADAVNSLLTRILQSIPPEEARVISRAKADFQMNDFDKTVRPDAYKICQRHLTIPTEFGPAYKAAINSRRLVTVMETSEDKAAKMKEKPDVKGYSTVAAG
jgi:hypothetical protein